MLIARLATAVVGIPILIGLVWLGGPLFVVAVALAAGLAGQEAWRLLGEAGPNPLAPFPHREGGSVHGASNRTSPFPVREGGEGVRSGLPSAIGACLLVLAAGFGSDAVLAGVAGVLVFCVAWSTLPARSRPVSFAPTFASAIYAGFPLSLVVLVRSWTGPAIVLPLLPGSPTVTSGVAWVLLTLTVTWATDSGAYLVGRAVGRRPFWPRLSPKKTWEGTIAGLLAGALVGMVWSAGFQWSGLTGGALGACGALAAVVGDLTESGLKRQAGAKESGTLLPGHGGLLDRLDSLAFSTVVVFFTGTLNQSAHFLR